MEGRFFDLGLAGSTLWAQWAAVRAFLIPELESIAPLVSSLLKDCHLGRPILGVLALSWDFPLILSAWQEAPFEPLEEVGVIFLPLRLFIFICLFFFLPVAIVSARRVGELGYFLCSGPSL